MPQSGNKPSGGRRYGGQSAEERAAEQRRKLMDAGLELLGTVGYRAMTVRMLSKQAGLSDRYFYRNFESTEDLLIAVYERAIEAIQSEVMAAVLRHPGADDIEHAIEAGLEAFFSSFKNAKVARICWLEVLGVSPRVDRAYSARILVFAQLVETIARQRLPDIDLPDEELQQVAVGLVGAVIQSAMQWLLSDYTADSAVLVRANARLFKATFASLSA